MSIIWRTDATEVLVQAAADRRDILLWWTAPWCPPCNELDAMVFAQPGFADGVSALHLLKLESDAEDAQRWGDRFALESYPALWLLDADAKPRLVLPMAMQPDALLEVIALARRLRPLPAIAAALMAGDPTTADERRLVAMHWWQQDRLLQTAPTDPAHLLAEACRQAHRDPPEVQLRLLVHWMTAARTVPQETVAPESDFASRLMRCLRDDAVTYADAYLLWVDLSQLEVLGTSHADELRRACLDALAMQLADHPLQRTQRLVARFAQLQLLDLVDADAAATLKRDAAADAVQTLREVSDRREWVSVANMAGHLLQACGEGPCARLVFEDAARTAQHPGYFLQYLGDLQLDEGDIESGLATWCQAYASSIGPATRFAMGVRLLHRLMQHTPADVSAIEATIKAVRSEILGDEADACGSNRRNLRQLEDEIAAWRAHASMGERACDGASCPA